MSRLFMKNNWIWIYKIGGGYLFTCSRGVNFFYMLEGVIFAYIKGELYFCLSHQPIFPEPLPPQLKWPLPNGATDTICMHALIHNYNTIATEIWIEYTHTHYFLITDDHYSHYWNTVYPKGQLLCITRWHHLSSFGLSEQ